MHSDFDIERRDGDVSETGVILVVTVLLVSCILHVVLMYFFSGCTFASLPLNLKLDRKKLTKDVPIMEVQKMTVDPVTSALLLKPRPVAAPNNEKAEARQDRLAQATPSSVVPELPQSASALPVNDVSPDPMNVENTQWVPRQEIMSVKAPVVPDDQVALPRIVIPKVERVINAPDILPSYDVTKIPRANFTADSFLQSVSLASLVDGKGGFAGGGDGVVAPVPLPALDFAHKINSSVAPSLSLIASEAEATQKAVDEERLAAERELIKKRQEELLRNANKPQPVAPQTIQIDEAVVEQAKDSVRRLRDDLVAQGKPFDENVDINLGYWIDPNAPRYKYFRVKVASRTEKSLPVISKDIVFLLDASGSIANDRLKKCRKAILAALRQLNTGDRFNVVAFRDKFTFAFPEVAWKEVTQPALDKVEDWLSNITAHGYTDVFRTLRGVLAMPRDPSRPIVAFVITDGEATSGVTRSAEIISRFSELNGGLISVYMYGVKDSANQYLMDMLTHSSRGTWDMNRKLRWNAADGIPELAKNFERPVLTDISVVFTAASQTEVYPQLVPSLTFNAPIEMYGVCPSDQKELVFSMRGLNGAQAYESVFRISFDKANQLDAQVKTAWAKRRLYAMISAYTLRPNEKLKEEMRIFANAYGVTNPYEKEMR